MSGLLRRFDAWPRENGLLAAGFRAGMPAPGTRSSKSAIPFMRNGQATVTLSEARRGRAGTASAGDAADPQPVQRADRFVAGAVGQ